MNLVSDPRSLFGFVAEQLRERNIAFLFVRETEAEDSLLSHIKSVFGGPVIANEEMSHADAERLIRAGSADAVAFGRDFIATPDLTDRLALGVPLNTPNPSTFYGGGAEGYTDYPVLAQL